MIACAFFAIGAAGCASSNSGSATVTSDSKSSPDVIKQLELATSASNNAYDAISRLRPNWFRYRGTSSVTGGTARQGVIAVYLDNHRIGDQSALRTMSIAGIKSIQWYDAARAATVLSDIGSDAIVGAIVLKSQ
jgi:hypothetical protein